MTERIPGLVKPPKYQHIEGFEANGVTIRIAIYMETPLKMRAVRALRREIKLMMERYNIEAPYEHCVYHKADYEPVGLLTAETVSEKCAAEAREHQEAQ